MERVFHNRHVVFAYCCYIDFHTNYMCVLCYQLASTNQRDTASSVQNTEHIVNSDNTNERLRRIKRGAVVRSRDAQFCRLRVTSQSPGRVITFRSSSTSAESVIHQDRQQLCCLLRTVHDRLTMAFWLSLHSVVCYRAGCFREFDHNRLLSNLICILCSCLWTTQ